MDEIKKAIDKMAEGKKYVKKIMEENDHFGINKLRGIEMRFWRL